MSTKYTQDHEWISVDGDTATVGITDYAQEQLGEVVFVELPDVGNEVGQGDESAVIESVKAAGELKSPASGAVKEINELLNDEPGKVNEDPQGDGWFFKITITNATELDDLMDDSAYQAYVESLG